MRLSITIATWCLVCSLTPLAAADEVIRPGQHIKEVSKAMQAAGYRETSLDMAPVSKDTNLKMWSVGDGVLIFSYSAKDKRTLGISYYLCDERPKATRKTFDLCVTEFNPKTKEMKIQLPNPAPE